MPSDPMEYLENAPSKEVIKKAKKSGFVPDPRKNDDENAEAAFSFIRQAWHRSLT